MVTKNMRLTVFLGRFTGLIHIHKKNVDFMFLISRSNSTTLMHDFFHIYQEY